MNIKESVEFIANIATPVSVILAILFFCFEKRRANQMSTMEAYNCLQKEVFDELNMWSPSEIREAMTNPTSDSYKILSGFLARIEHFCVGLKTRIYDFNTFYQVAHGYFDGARGTLYNRIIPTLEAKTLNAHEDYFSNIHWVWKKMKKYDRHTV